VLSFAIFFVLLYLTNQLYLRRSSGLILIDIEQFTKFGVR